MKKKPQRTACVCHVLSFCLNVPLIAFLSPSLPYFLSCPVKCMRVGPGWWTDALKEKEVRTLIPHMTSEGVDAARGEREVERKENERASQRKEDGDVQDGDEEGRDRNKEVALRGGRPWLSFFLSFLPSSMLCLESE